MNKFRFAYVIIVGLLTLTAQAELKIQITEGVAGAVPIAVPSFEGPRFANRKYTQTTPVDIAEVVSNDLKTSGRFRPIGSNGPRISTQPSGVDLHHWQRQGVENVVLGNIQPIGNNRYSVSFELWDVYKAPREGQGQVRVQNGELISEQSKPDHILTSKRYPNISGDELRSLAHHISDVIYETLTGVRGAFSTRIAYILVRPSDTSASDEYILEVADVDGHNPKQLVRSREPLMSPSWSPDGKKLAFVSFEKKQSEIYVMDIVTGKRELLTTFPGINGAPAWSHDGRELALVLSKDGSPKIYTMDLATKKLRQVTKGFSIDTEPEWGPDGKTIFFTSNRGGKPQIYKVDLDNGRTQRVTYEGNYNARPTLAPRGNKLVMIHRGEDGIYRLASQDLKTGELRFLTHADLDESPSIAPNGDMVLYGTNAYGRRVLGIVTIDGRGQLRLPAREGSVQEPAWSPYLS